MKRVRQGLVIFYLVFAGSIPSFGATGETDSIASYQLSVQELFRLGQENSLRLRTSRLNTRIEKERVNAAKTERLPQIDVSASAGYLGQPVMFRHGLSDPTYPDAPHWSQDYGMQIIQPLYQGGRVRLGIERAEAEHELAELTLAADESEMKLEYLREYLNLFSLYKQRDVFGRNIAESERRQQDIHNMYREGLVTSNDEIRSNLQLRQYRLDWRIADDNIRVASTRLDVLLGLEEWLVIIPDTTVLDEATAPLKNCDYYMEEAYSGNPQMRIARENEHLSQVNFLLGKTEYMPRLDLIANYGLARPLTSTMEDKFSQNWNIGIGLTFNLSSFYKNKPLMKENRIALEMSRTALMTEWQELYIRINETYASHRQSLDRVSTLQLAVTEAEENYRIVRNRYMNQLSILTDLLDAESVLLDSELQLVNAKINAVYTYCQLLQACGRL